MFGGDFDRRGLQGREIARCQQILTCGLNSDYQD